MKSIDGITRSCKLDFPSYTMHANSKNLKYTFSLLFISVALASVLSVLYEY